MKVTRAGWKGHIHVFEPPSADGRWYVEWDACSPDGWWIYDTCTMSEEQIRIMCPKWKAGKERGK